ncbi:hypothetical protein ANCCAN_05573 [Ancylostoma caninum]|uniref:Uncharacterized protein n=1 Tax=Ancylostoma caninum TaxID=29170 RepID=A0A368GZH3_ANCCA|nr:hypothetical protein ANCCAN_05573 [Ancylostoma caninum]
MRHAVPPANAVPRVPVNRSRPQSTASYNSLASSGLENIVWRNSSLSTSTSDSQRRHTLCEDDTAPRVVSSLSLGISISKWYLGVLIESV